MSYYYFYFEYKFYIWNRLYLPFGFSTFHTSLILMANEPNKILGPFGIFSLSDGPVNRERVILW